MVYKVWRKADAWLTQGGHMADNQSGFQADTKQTHGGHMADKLRRRGQSISRPAFFSKREPHSKLFGEHIKFVLHHVTSCYSANRQLLLCPGRTIAARCLSQHQGEVGSVALEKVCFMSCSCCLVTTATLLVQALLAVLRQ